MPSQRLEHRGVDPAKVGLKGEILVFREIERRRGPVQAAPDRASP